jgi:O-antigen/teichoic acid export membrane protein
MPRARIVRDSLIIGVAQIISNISGFLLLPLITAELGPNDYGIWIQLSLIVSLAVPICQLSLSSALIRYLSAEKNVLVFTDRYYSVLCFVTLVAGCASTFLLLLSENLSQLIFHDINTSNLIRLISPLLFVSSLEVVVLVYFRIIGQIRLFGALSIMKTIVQLSLVSAFLILDYSISGVILGNLISIVIEILIGTTIIVRHLGIVWPSFRDLKRMILFSVPLVPNNSIKWLADSSDRFLISFFLGTGMAGIYSAAYTLGSVVALLSVPIQFILYPLLSKTYDEGRKKDVSTYISTSIRLYLLIAIPAATGVGALAPDLMTAITSNDYSQGSEIVPIFALTSLINGLFIIISSVVIVVNKTRYHLFFSTIAAGTNIILNLALIPVAGIIGASIASFSAIALMTIITIKVSKRHLPFEVSWHFCIKSLVSSALMAGFILAMDVDSLIEIIFTIILGITIYFGSLYVIKGYGPIELDILRYVIVRSKQILHR